MKKSMSMEEIRMFSRPAANVCDEDDIMLTDNIDATDDIINKSSILNNPNIIMPDEFSRNRRNNIKSNVGEPGEGIRSRNAVVPSFHISETNLTNDVIKEDDENNDY
jgi:hypothetical protein